MPEERGRDEGQVLDRAGERADLVQRRGEGHEAVAAHSPVRGLEAVDPAERSRLANGAAGIGAEGEGSEAGRHRRGGAAGGAAGHPRGVPGIAGLLVTAVLGGGAHGELVHVGLADEDRSLGFEAGEGGGGEGRPIALEDPGSAGRGQALEVENVLHRHGHPRESGRCRSRLVLPVEPAGLLERALAEDGEEGVHPRLDQGDAVEVRAGHLLGGHGARRHPLPDLGSGELVQSAHQRIRGTRKSPSWASGAAASARSRGRPSSTTSSRKASLAAAWLMGGTSAVSSFWIASA